MRWTDVPYLDGNTDPVGEVMSPYSGWGIPGALRMAPSQPRACRRIAQWSCWSIWTRAVDAKGYLRRAGAYCHADGRKLFNLSVRDQLTGYNDVTTRMGRPWRPYGRIEPLLGALGKSWRKVEALHRPLSPRYSPCLGRRANVQDWILLRQFQYEKEYR